LGIKLKEDGIKDYWNDMQRGIITLEEAIRKSYHTDIPDDKMREIISLWKENWKMDPEMIVIAKNLSKKYTIAVLSNVDKLSTEMYKDDLTIINFIKHQFRSFELGLIKPEREIYEYTLKKLNTNPEECIFIDDKEENVNAANKLGIHGILFQNKKQLIRELQKLGIEVE
jgi:putative hydrolase of the HAD superfamily